MYTFKKVFSGRTEYIGRWTKELIYNIYIQVVHALFYSLLIGLTIKFGNESTVLSYFGSILTLIVFGFIFKLDGFIRKMFNFIGGKSTVQVKDYKSIMKHPIQSAKDEASYIADTAKAIPQNVKSALKPSSVKAGLIKFKDNAIYEAKETIASLDGSRINLNDETKKNKESRENNKNKKSSNSLSIQNALNSIQNSVKDSVIGKGIGLVSKIQAFSRKDMAKIRARNAKNRKDLKQDDETVKRLNKVLKRGNRRKKIASNAVSKNRKKTSLSDKFKATIIDDKETPEEDIEELKDCIDKNNGDMMVALYSAYGLAPFIYPGLGSTYLGLSVLASARNEEKQDRINRRQKNGTKKRTLVKPKLKKAVGKTKEAITGTVSFAKRKVYKIKSFTANSVKTIARSLNRRLIIASGYLSIMVIMGKKIATGKVKAVGAYIQNKSDQVRRTNIHYKAKVSIPMKNEAVANLELKSYSAVRKGTNVNANANTRVPSNVNASTSANNTSVTTNVHAGINSNTSVIPNVNASADVNASQDEIANENGEIRFYMPVKLRKLEAYAEVSKYHERVGDGDWATLDALSSEVVGMQERRENKQLIKAVSAGEVSVESLVDMGQAIKIDDNNYILFADANNVKDMSEEQKFERITNVAIVDTVMKLDTTLEELDITKTEVQDDILDSLIEKGVVESSVKQNEESRAVFIETIQENKESLLGENKEEYQRLVVRKELSNALSSGELKVDVSDKSKSVDTEQLKEELKEQFIQGISEHSTTLKETVKDAVKIEAQDLISDLEAAVDVAKEEVKKGIEVYGFSKDNETETRKKKTRVKAAKGGEEEYSSDEEILIRISGAVVSPGEYKLKLSNRIRDAILVAGGITPEADVEKVIGIQDDFLSDGQYIYISSRDDLDDLRSEIELVVKDYMVENEIKYPESLRKLKHKKVIVAKLRRKFKDKNLDQKQIEDLVEERIKEIIKTREFLNDTKNSIQIVQTDQTKTQTAINSDRSLDAAFERFNEMSRQEYVAESETEEESAETSMDMDKLLGQITEMREKVLVSANSSNNSRKHMARQMLSEEMRKVG